MLTASATDTHAEGNKGAMVDSVSCPRRIVLWTEMAATECYCNAMLCYEPAIIMRKKHDCRKRV